MDRFERRERATRLTRGHRQVGGRLGADAVGQLVGLVDDDGVVLAKELALAACVDAKQGVIRDDDVGLGCFQSGCLGEALVDEWAMLAQALGLGDRRVMPGTIRDAGHQVVAVPRRGVTDPLTDTQDLLAELTRRADAHVSIIEQGSLGGIPAVQLVQARVVRPSLEHRNLQAHARRRGDRVNGDRRVLDQNLTLEGQRRRRNNPAHPIRRAVRQQGHQVAQRLTRARARLHQQVLAVLKRSGAFGDHRGLSLARGPTHVGDDRIEDAARGLDQVLAH